MLVAAPAAGQRPQRETDDGVIEPRPEEGVRAAAAADTTPRHHAGTKKSLTRHAGYEI